MSLPFNPPFAPMEALAVDQIPDGPEWQYEPKWDGFRCLVFRDGQKVELQSKSGRPLTRYFPELVHLFQTVHPEQFALDGEIVVPVGDGFSFDALLQRIHPAASRVARLATDTPAIFIAFDLLVDSEGHPLIDLPLLDRRQHLERFFKARGLANDSIRLSPVTKVTSSARAWLRKTGRTLDGVIAKRLDFAYRSGDRTGMQKIKNYRSADCVVGGFRYNEGTRVVGSLLLGLHDPKGVLHHVGFTSSIKQRDKPALTKKLEALISPPGFTGNAPGGPSRWSSDRSHTWEPLRPELVVEVCYDHFSDGRFRHGTRLLRWRPDKAAAQCKLDQVVSKAAGLEVLLP